MIGLVKTAPGPSGISLMTIPEPVAAPGEVVIDVVAVGLCGTDVEIIADRYPLRSPVVLGHEVTGIVSSAGSVDHESWVGSRVVVETHLRSCGQCAVCRSGRVNLCHESENIGSIHDGGLAPRIAVPAVNLHRVPAGVSEFGAALAEPLACVVQCLVVVPTIAPGDRVLVVGPGAIGFLAAQVAQVTGALVTVLGLSSDSMRLDTFEEVRIRSVTTRPRDAAFDVVIECSGSGAGATAALESVRPGGRYVAMAMFGRDVTVPLDQLRDKELTMTSGSGSTAESWDRALRLMATGAIELDAAISEVVGLEYWSDAIEAVRRGIGMKILIDPRDRVVGREQAMA